jgi:tRNA (guanine-N7-)-methyltransferase
VEDPVKKRGIRSYVLRVGRMTPVQKRALEDNWPRWGLEYDDGPLDIDAVFGRPGARVLEIGFGMGDSLVEMAEARPDTNFIGIEVHRPGIGKLFHGLENTGANNVRVYCHDAVEILRDCVADASLDTVQIFFPDPWHKKRHQKRRLVQAPFVGLLVKKLKKGGTLHIATDWENYAEQMMDVLSAETTLVNSFSAGCFSPRPNDRPLTKFEKRGERLGHGVWDLLFTRT